MRFEKWQALGNDYLIVERDALPWPLTPERVAWLCDRHIGPGGDGVLELAPPDAPGFVARLRIFNPDGSEAELSGNGAREAVLYLRRRGWTDARRLLDPDRRGGDPADDHLRRRPARSTWAAPRRRRPPTPAARPTARRGRRLPLPARAHRQPAVRDPRRRPARPSRRWTWPCSARAIEHAAQLPAAHERLLVDELEPGHASARGSSSAAWARRAASGTGAVGAAVATSCAAATRP